MRDTGCPYSLEDAIEIYADYCDWVKLPVDIEEFISCYDPETFNPSDERPLACYLTQFRKGDIPKTAAMLAIEEAEGQDLGELLVHLYYEEGMSTTKIGERFGGINRGTIGRWMAMLGITRRTKGEARLTYHGGRKPSSGDLRTMHHGEGLSIVQMGERCNVHPSGIRRWMRDAEIPIRNGRLSANPGRQTLVELLAGGLRYTAIGKRFGVTASAVGHWVRKARITEEEVLGAQRVEVNGYTLDDALQTYRGYCEVEEMDAIVNLKTFLKECSPEDGLPTDNPPLARLVEELGKDRRITKKMKKLEAELQESLPGYLIRCYIGYEESMREIADDLEMGLWVVAQWMKKFGIPTRSMSAARLATFGGTKPTSEQLERLYIEAQRSTTDIADIYGVTSSTVLCWIKEAGIPYRRQSEVRLTRFGGRRPDAEELRRLYWDEGLSTVKIGEQCGVTNATIRRWMKKEEIPRRSISQAILNNGEGGEKPSDSDLRRWYVEEHLTSTQIAARCGVHLTSVNNWVKDLGITLRSAGETQRLNRGGPFPTAEELTTLYWKKEQSLADIAGYFGVNAQTVWNWMDSYDIPRRTKEEAREIYFRRQRDGTPSLEEGVDAYLRYLEREGTGDAVDVTTFFSSYDPETLAPAEGRGPLHLHLRFMGEEALEGLVS